MREARSATAWAPASLSNLGPGFDALGIALTGLGDQVTVRMGESSGIDVRFDPEGSWQGPTDPQRNTAAVAARYVAGVLGYTGGLSVEIRKGLPAGTGLGSSAASSVAAAVATERVLQGKISRKDMIAAVVAGESATSGQGHADNVLPSLFGGFVLMRSSTPIDFMRMEGWSDLALVVALPDTEVLTRDARKALPKTVALSAAVDHAARLALMSGAINRQDLAGLGRWMMSDDIIVPARRSLWPYLDAVVEAAMHAGASGCTISGSGPALVSCCDHSRDRSCLAQISDAMKGVLRAHGLSCVVSNHQVDNHGARLITDQGAVSWRTGLQASIQDLGTKP